MDNFYPITRKLDVVSLDTVNVKHNLQVQPVTLTNLNFNGPGIWWPYFKYESLFICLITMFDDRI